LKKSKLKRTLKTLLKERLILEKTLDYTLKATIEMNKTINELNEQLEKCGEAYSKIAFPEKQEAKTPQPPTQDELDEAKHYALEALQEALDTYKQTTGESITINLEESN